MNKRLLMTQSEFATHRGVRRSAVSNWKKAELLVWAEGEDGRLLVDVERTEARLASRLDQGRGRPKSSEVEAALRPAEAGAVRQTGEENSREELRREDVINRRLKNRKEAGELVPLAEYERRAVEATRQCRERVMSVVRTQAERLGTETDPRTIVNLLEAEMDRVFLDLASGIEEGSLVVDDLAEAEGGDEVTE